MSDETTGTGATPRREFVSSDNETIVPPIDQTLVQPPVAAQTGPIEPVFTEPVAPEPVAPEPAAETVTVVPVIVENVPTAASDSEPVIATTDPAAVETERPHETAAPAQTVFVTAPTEPVHRGNRGFGFLIVIIATIIFAALYGVIIAIIEYVRNGTADLDFLTSIDFYVPVAFFFVGFLIVALIANRAGWWAHVIGSLLIALFIYFGTVGVGLIRGGVIMQTPNDASRLFSEALLNPYVIAAALLGREVSLWFGAAISARGRRVKAKNIEARETFERETAESRAAANGTADYGV
jgi:hypothetical protein